MVGGGSDIKEDQLIRTRLIISGAYFNRVTGISEIDEVDTFDDPARIYVKTRDYSLRKHILLRSADVRKVGKNLKSHIPAFFWVELTSVKIARFNGRVYSNAIFTACRHVFRIVRL